jgi:hypothetical protein
MMRTQRQKQREMKSFILHRNALATEKSVANPVLAPVLGCSQQALLRFRAVSKNVYNCYFIYKWIELLKVKWSALVVFFKLN